jgi:hypothetical protein
MFIQWNCYSPPKSVAKHTDMHISYLVFSHIHIQTNTDTNRHIHTHTYLDTDTYMQYRHDTDILYSQPPEPTGNSVYTSSSSCVKLAWNTIYQVTHGATATASELDWQRRARLPKGLPNCRLLYCVSVWRRLVALARDAGAVMVSPK